MQHEQLIEEIKQIPADKLAEVYDLIHYFRLGLEHEKKLAGINKRPIGLAKGLFNVPASFYNPLPESVLDDFEGKS